MASLVLDSSALITLAGANALPLLRLSPHRALTVSGVYSETVEAGLARAHPDAVAIREAFEIQIVAIQNPRSTETLAGISRTDSQVLLLAEEVAAAALLVNDKPLWRKAEQRGLPARFTAEFVEDLYQAGKISRKRRDGLLDGFVSRLRYSEEFIRALLLAR